MDIFRWIRQQWDRAAAIAAGILGLVSLLLGWLGVSRSTLPTEQIPYLASGAVLGLFALGVGATLWLSADLRDEWRKLDQIHQTLQRGADAAPEPATTPEPVASTAEMTPASAPEPVPATLDVDTTGAAVHSRARNVPLRARAALDG